MMFASGGSDGNGYDGYDEEPQYSDEPTESTRRTPGAPRGSATGSGGSGGDRGGGRQRTVQFQPEERYWTEYLRIALPIIGLLLMIGLFWYWASQLAGDDNNPDEPIATQSPGATELITPDSTPEPTEQIISQPTQETEETPTEEAASTPATESEEPEEEPTEEAEDAFQQNQAVIAVVSLNMRDDASTSADSLGTLEVNTVLEIQSGPYEADGYIWWEVIVSETGEVGFVAQEDPETGDPFIEAAD